MKLADTWSWVWGRAISSFYSRHELQETRQRGANYLKVKTALLPKIARRIYIMSNFICRNEIYSINFILLTQFLESLTAI